MTESNNIVINCTNVSKKFDYFFALKNVTFNIEKNTIFGIAGANGAGKTTLIKILSGILKPTSGKVDIQGMNYANNFNDIKEIMGLITDKSFLYEELTIYENLKFYDNLHFNFIKRNINEKIGRFLGLFELNDWIDEPIHNLSHGMKQKVEIIRALMHNPSILLLDEPFSGLDFKTIKLLLNLFQELKEKNHISIILTTHKIDILQKICNNLIVLRRGKLNKFLSQENYSKKEIKTYF